MYRRELPRTFELRDMAQKPPSPDAYFDEFCRRLQDSAVRLKHFCDVELELGGLDTPAWQHLKEEIAPLLRAKDGARGWRALFDKLNEAKAYNHLAVIGCTGIRFIPRSPVPGNRTPDLEGWLLDSTHVLCEVKTINISQGEVCRRQIGGPGTTASHLRPDFFGKLRSRLADAKQQMDSFCRTGPAKKLAYVIVNYDDMLHEYAAEYSHQLCAFVADEPVVGLEVVLELAGFVGTVFRLR